MILKNPNIRFLYDIKKVVYDKKWLKTAPNLELYYMYRGLKKKNELRYDITVIPAQMLGKEFIKTKGHEHINNYPELYEVLEGKAIFLMQKRKENSIQDVYAITAKKGKVIIVPSGYGHITINSIKKALKIGNWIYEKCKNDYSPIEKRKGFCYFYTKTGWIKNKSYKKIPKLHFEKPLNPVRKARIFKALEALKFSNGVKKLPKDLSFLKEK